MKKHTTYLNELIDRLNDNQTSTLETVLVGVFITVASFLVIWFTNGIN